MLFSSLILILTACAIGFTSAAATPHALARWSSRHSSLQPLQKRASGQFTYFAVGMGACGKWNTADDFIVALNTPSWDGGSHCFQTITITINGQTTQAQIVDRCESCGPGDLDFSLGLFHHFGGTEAQGVMHGTWNYGGQEPSSTTTPKPTPSSTSTSTRPSSTSTPPPSTSSEPPKSSSSSSSSTPPSSSSTNVAAPTPTGVLAQSLFALVDLGGLVVAAGAAR